MVPFSHFSTTIQTVNRNNQTADRLIAESLAMEERLARDAGALGFMTRAMTLATLPHRAVKGPFFTRRNGNFTMTMSASDPNIALPYGAIPRLVLAWICTEVVRTQERDLALGDSMSAFMRELGMLPTGGRWGTIPRLKSQVKRLFSCHISASYDDPEKTILQGHRIADRAILWWEAPPDQKTIWNSTVRLSEPFYDEVLAHPIPVDVRALKALKKSPLALDAYVWLTYRMSYLDRPTTIPWKALRLQFGSDYTRVWDFKAKFVQALQKVQVVYPNLRLDTDEKGLTLRPSPTHILPG